MKIALRVYVAGVVGTGLSFLCHVFNHYPLPCRWTQNRLYWWADGVLNPEPDAPLPHPHVTELCGRMPSSWTGGVPPQCTEPKGHKGEWHSSSTTGSTWSWWEALR